MVKTLNGFAVAKQSLGFPCLLVIRDIHTSMIISTTYQALLTRTSFDSGERPSVTTYGTRIAPVPGLRRQNGLSDLVWFGLMVWRDCYVAEGL